MHRIILYLFIIVLASCQSKESKNENTEQNPSSPHQEMNAIYYWKTVCSLDNADYEFLKDNDVERAYVRFFDVVPDESPLAVEEIIPNASLQMKDSIPVADIVPTVFITQDALLRMKGKHDIWADKIVNRVQAMCSYNDLPEPNEIQLDCDWTESSRDNFFELCRNVKASLLLQDSTATVSATIRLHQLSQEAPPVDYGVLMIYNTGSFRNISEDNSIISKETVEPYLKNLPSYPLHLDIAYPTYNWQLLFRNNTFVGLVRNELPSDEEYFRMSDDSHLRVIKDVQVGELNLRKDDIIRIEMSDFNTIKAVKDMVEKSLRGKPHSNIIYHLDSKNLSNYTDDEIKNIYN